MKFAHITDTQLGYVQYGLPAREQDFTNAFRYCISTAMREKVDLVVFGGDIFEHQKPLGRIIRLVQEEVQLLKSKGIQVAGVEGNHDLSDGNWLDVCDIHDLELSPLTIKDVTFVGMHYRRDKSFEADFEEWSATIEHADVVVLHQAIAEKTPFTTVSGENIIKVMKPKGMKYLALGHIHTGFSIDMDGVKVICPGSTEMTDINEAREKRFPVVEIDKTKVNVPLNVVMHDIPVRPIIYYTVDTEDSLKKLIDMMKTDNLSLVVASVNGELMDGVLRLETEAEKLGVAYRISKHSAEVTAIEAAPTWEREKANIDLKDQIAKDYPVDTVEHGIIAQIISTPERAEEIFSQFLTEKVEELTNGRSKKKQEERAITASA